MPASGSYYYPGVSSNDIFRGPIDIGAQSIPVVSDASGYLPVITDSHSRIHKGQIFSALCISSSIAIGATTYFALKTPTSASNYVHLRYKFDTTGACIVNFYENSTVAASRKFCIFKKYK